MADSPSNDSKPSDSKPEGDLADRKRWSVFRQGRGRNLGLLVGGTALGQAITVIVLPILTRPYSPSDFGAMAVFVSLVVPLSAIAAFRYDMAIPLQTSDREAGSLLWLSGLLILLFTAFLTVILVPLSPRVAQLAQVPELEPYLWLAPVAFMAGGFYHALSYLAVRHRAFRLLATTRVNQGIGQAVSQIGIGTVSSGPLGLLVGITIRLGSGTITLIRASQDQLQTLSPPHPPRKSCGSL